MADTFTIVVNGACWKTHATLEAAREHAEIIIRHFSPCMIQGFDILCERPHVGQSISMKGIAIRGER